MDARRNHPSAETPVSGDQRRETRDYQTYTWYSGYAIFGLCLGLGILLLALGFDPYIPVPVWIALLIGSLAAGFAAATEIFRRRTELALYYGAILGSWALVLTASDQGMLVILLVLVAALGSYIVPIRTVMIIVILNNLVVTLHMVIHGADVVEFAVTTVFNLVIHCAAVFSTYALYRETQLREELEEKNLELEAAGILLEDSAATAERLRISRELHDAIGHQLTVLNLELEAAKHRIAQYDDAPTELPAHIERAGEVAKELLSDVRSTVGELRDSAPGDLGRRLRRLAAAVHSLEIHIETEENLHVDDRQAAALVRAAQEIITNTVKHSGAQELSLTVRRQDPDVVLTGINDGTAPKNISLGHGLTGLRERAELLGGQLSVSSHPEFTVRFQIPLREEGR